MTEILIIGGGLAGLACALTLQQAGVSWRLLEATPHVGGRVGTEQVEGFRLDRGFQIFLTAYPEARRLLDYQALDLRYFYPGAYLAGPAGLTRLGDPLRRPQSIVETLSNSFATLQDKALILKLRSEVLWGPPEALLQGPEMSVGFYLRRFGFSERLIEGFFRPFLGGIFFDPDLKTSHRLFRFLFRMFAVGPAAIPAQGMAEIPQQLAQRLDPERLQLRMPVERLSPGRVELADGSTVYAHQIVLATDPLNAARLCRLVPPRRMRGGLTLYFSAPLSPVSEPILVLNSQGRGPVNHLMVLSQAAPEYAPPGQHLIALVVLFPHAERPVASLLPQIQYQMQGWFGPQVKHWRFLRAYHLPASLPDQSPPFLQPASRSGQVAPGVWICGDFCETGSIQGALASGRKAAEKICSS